MLISTTSLASSNPKTTLENPEPQGMTDRQTHSKQQTWFGNPKFRNPNIVAIVVVV
jgi:hypothetical protein